jgi:glycopeptide antibiotics resistance protein
MQDRGAMRHPAAVLTFIWLGLALLATLLPIPRLDGIAPDNATPFGTIRRYVDAGIDGGAVRQILGNLLLLAGIGFPAPLAFRWLDRAWAVALSAATLSAGIELAQLALPGRASDVDDVLLNVLGALLAFGVGRALSSAAEGVPP